METWEECEMDIFVFSTIFSHLPYQDDMKMQIILSPVASLKWYIRGGALVLCRKIGFGPNNFFRVIKGVVMILGS